MARGKEKKRVTHHQATIYSLLAVLGLLLMTIVLYGNETSECYSNLKRIGEALQAYKSEHGLLPENHHQLVPQYLEQLPNCPAIDFMAYRTVFGRGAGYGDPNDSEYFLVRCTSLKHHRDGFPAYDSDHGLLYDPPQERAGR